MIDLEIIWTALASSYTNNGELVFSTWKRIESRYRDNSRIYHNLDHIFFVFTLADSIQADFENKDAAYFALFYHDYHYDPESFNNEEKSAEAAERDLNDLNVEEEVIDRCIHHILATKDHLPSTDPDTNLILDLDLSILGSDPQTYVGYADSIRMEYSIYPDQVFYKERQKLLEALLRRDRIFHTQLFHELFEKKARTNILAEISTINEMNTTQEL